MRDGQETKSLRICAKSSLKQSGCEELGKHYHIILASRVEKMLRRHVLFISNVSVRRTELFVDGFEDVLKQLKENPYLYPFDEDENGVFGCRL